MIEEVIDSKGGLEEVLRFTRGGSALALSRARRFGPPLPPLCPPPPLFSARGAARGSFLSKKNRAITSFSVVKS